MIKWELGLFTRDIAAISVGVAFNFFIGILPSPLDVIVDFLVPYFMFVFVEVMAKHKLQVVILITTFYTMAFYVWFIPRYESINMFVENTFKTINLIIEKFSSGTSELLPEYPLLTTTLAGILVPLNYLAGYFGAKETVKKLKLIERVGGLK